MDSGRFIDNLVVHNMGGSGVVELQQVVSRKTHTGADTFDVPLPLTGAVGIEPRTGGANGDHTLVFTFNNPVTSVSGVSVTSGNGSVSSSFVGANPQEYYVNLTGVTNAQVITVTLTGVNAVCANSPVSVSVPMGVLLGDVNQTGVVDGNDVSAVQATTRQRATSTNFRTDVNTTGSIDGNDVSIVQGKTRTRLP